MAARRLPTSFGKAPTFFGLVRHRPNWNICTIWELRQREVVVSYHIWFYCFTYHVSGINMKITKKMLKILKINHHFINTVNGLQNMNWQWSRIVNEGVQVAAMRLKRRNLSTLRAWTPSQISSLWFSFPETELKNF